MLASPVTFVAVNMLIKNKNFGNLIRINLYPVFIYMLIVKNIFLSHFCILCELSGYLLCAFNLGFTIFLISLHKCFIC